MSKPAAAAAVPAFVADDLTWEGFLRDVPARATRRVIEQRDAIEDEAGACARTQSWSPRSIRSGWASELRDVVEAIDALREAHAAVGEAESDDEHEALVLARCEAFDALEDAIEAANDEAVRLAGLVAQREADVGVEARLLAADRAADDAEWEEALAERLDRPGDGDCGWTVTREDDGTLTVTGWASTRVVQADDNGDVLLGRDPADVEEHAVHGRVAFQIVRDEDGSDEPDGLCATVAEAVEAASSLAAIHGLAGWQVAWDVKPRWVEPDAVRVLSPGERLGLREVHGFNFEALCDLPQENADVDDPAWALAGDPDEDVVCRVTATTDVAPAGSVVVHSNGHARLFVPA